jgi:hypothetical protein
VDSMWTPCRTILCQIPLQGLCDSVRLHTDSVWTPCSFFFSYHLCQFFTIPNLVHMESKWHPISNELSEMFDKLP